MNENEEILREALPAQQATQPAETPAPTPKAPTPPPYIHQPSTPQPFTPRPSAPALQPAPEGKSAPIPEMQPSHFDGKTIQLIGWRLLGILLTGITLGIGAPWVHCMVLRWEAKHTLVEGQRLQFDGKGHQLLGRYLLWGLLTLVTFGIFIIFLPVRFHKWHTKHLSFAGSAAIPEKKLSGGIIALIAVVLAIGLLLVGLGGFMAYRAFMAPAEQVTEPTPPPTSESTTAPTTEATTEATIGATVWYVNSPTGLYVRDCADEDYTTIDYLEYGTKVLVEYWEGKLGFIGYGWCNGDYLTQEKPGSVSQNESTEPTKGSSQAPSQSIPGEILGSWVGVVYDDETKTLIQQSHYKFSADGTFSGALVHISYRYHPSYGWISDQSYGAGSQIFNGTFTYDGSTLVLTYGFFEFESSLPEPRTLSAYVEDGVLHISEYNWTSYYQGNINDIGNKLVPNPSIPDTTLDSSIVGTWYTIDFQEVHDGINFGFDQCYEFKSDGTFQTYYMYISLFYNPSTLEVSLLDPGYTSDLHYGTYTYDGSTLALVYTDESSGPYIRRTDATVLGDTLLLYGEKWERGSYAEIANRVFG